MNWKQEKAYSDLYANTVKRILGPFVIKDASFIEDTQQATDYRVGDSTLVAGVVSIACRIRRPAYATQATLDFTIRSGLASGAKTELEKILDGCGDLFFYGAAKYGDNDNLAVWYVTDLNVFRRWFVERCERNDGRMPGYEQVNGDGVTKFRAFSWHGMPDDFIIGCGGELIDTHL